LSSSRSDCGILAKIVTDCSSTRARLNKVDIIDSLVYKCDELIQDINHILWTCPLPRADYNV